MGIPVKHSLGETTAFEVRLGKGDIHPVLTVESGQWLMRLQGYRPLPIREIMEEVSGEEPVTVSKKR